VKVCAQPSCPTLTRTTYCRKHTRDKRRASDRRRPNARQRGYDSEHRRDREAYFRAFPICQWEEGCIAPATDLDHIDGNPFNRSWENYRGYCRSHHSQRTARDQPGGWNQRLTP
jgi:5-methylcytosine-specific restriction protein A